MNISFDKRYASAASILLLSLATACGGQTEDPSSAQQPLTLDELGQQLDAGDKRVEVHVTSGLEAREIGLEAQMGHDEHLESALLDVAADGTLTLELGHLVVSVDPGARFRSAEDSNVPRQTWIDDMVARLGAGEPVFVRVSRDAAAASQAPSDGSFTATDVRVEDVDEAKIEMNVSADNLAAATDHGTLTILGLDIAITSDTNIHTDDGDDAADDDGAGGEPGDDNGAGGEPGDDNGAGGDGGANHG